MHKFARIICFFLVFSRYVSENLLNFCLLVSGFRVFQVSFQLPVLFKSIQTERRQFPKLLVFGLWRLVHYQMTYKLRQIDLHVINSLSLIFSTSFVQLINCNSLTGLTRRFPLSRLSICHRVAVLHDDGNRKYKRRMERAFVVVQRVLF